MSGPHFSSTKKCHSMEVGHRKANLPSDTFLRRGEEKDTVNASSLYSSFKVVQVRWRLCQTVEFVIRMMLIFASREVGRQFLILHYFWTRSGTLCFLGSFKIQYKAGVICILFFFGTFHHLRYLQESWRSRYTQTTEVWKTSMSELVINRFN